MGSVAGVNENADPNGDRLSVWRMHKNKDKHGLENGNTATLRDKARRTP